MRKVRVCKSHIFRIVVFDDMVIKGQIYNIKRQQGGAREEQELRRPRRWIRRDLK
ncbi:MAG: hypothetical protein K6E38_04400 [Fretibacterium sp.]|nr:hypothetical protein [Fretibacterium sp.]